MFATWSGVHVTISNPKFNFDQLLQEALSHEDPSDNDGYSTDEENAGEPGQGGPLEPPEPPPTETPSQPSPNSKDRCRARKKVQGHTQRATAIDATFLYQYMALT